MKSEGKQQAMDPSPPRGTRTRHGARSWLFGQWRETARLLTLYPTPTPTPTPTPNPNPNPNPNPYPTPTPNPMLTLPLTFTLTPTLTRRGCTAEVYDAWLRARSSTCARCWFGLGLGQGEG